MLKAASDGFSLIIILVSVVLVSVLSVSSYNLLLKNRNNPKITNKLDTARQTVEEINEITRQRSKEYGLTLEGIDETPSGSSLIYSKNKVDIFHFWPGQNKLSDSESELYIENNSDSELVIELINLQYFIDGTLQELEKSSWGILTEEKESTRGQKETSNAEPLTVLPGQSAEVHFEFEIMGNPGSTNRKMELNLTFLQEGETFQLVKSFRL